MRTAVDVAPPLDLRVVSFACERDLPEHVACIRSFLRHAGVPVELAIVSDGTHSAWSRDLLRAIHPCVSVVDWRAASRSDLPRALWDYAEANWRGRKLLVSASVAVERPVLMVDADVLFFAPASELRRFVEDDESTPRYLQDVDEGLFLDAEMLENQAEAAGSVNGGFAFLPKPLDWSLALRRLEARLRWGRTTFTGQTALHLALHQLEAQPFDRSRYVVSVDDRDVADDLFVGRETVMRHYVTPVRHKFWMMLSRQADSCAGRKAAGAQAPVEARAV